ncbi:MAG: ABC transporter permease [Pseudomonadota bacterium]|nr:ABC transporter permease [Pseudomonadota bacterium]
MSFWKRRRRGEIRVAVEKVARLLDGALCQGSIGTGLSLHSIASFLLQRLGWAVVTLLLLSVMVFFGAQVLPGNIGRAILGPLADAAAVIALNHELGVDRPLWVQYLDWITHFIRGDMGKSFIYHTPVFPFVLEALMKSLALALVVAVLVIPISLAGGVLAALKANRSTDRIITLVGLSMTIIPEFASGIVLILVFGVWLHWFPISAKWADGAGVFERLDHLILPALPLVLILFGYIARMARAGTIAALDSDYARTAILKGLPSRTVIWRHVLRNALLPTISVIGTQVGYLIGGLVVVETLFNYRGIGALIFSAAKAKDFPMLQAGVLTVGLCYTLAAILADLLFYLLNPRLRLGGGR